MESKRPGCEDFTLGSKFPRQARGRDHFCDPVRSFRGLLVPEADGFDFMSD